MKPTREQVQAIADRAQALHDLGKKQHGEEMQALRAKMAAHADGLSLAGPRYAGQADRVRRLIPLVDEVRRELTKREDVLRVGDRATISTVVTWPDALADFLEEEFTPNNLKVHLKAGYEIEPSEDGPILSSTGVMRQKRLERKDGGR